MVKKYIIQRNNDKQKQNINIKIHVGDKGKKKNKKYKSRKPAEKEGTSSYSYAQPYNPVYIQSGYPDNGQNAGALGTVGLKSLSNSSLFNAIGVSIWSFSS